MLGQKWEHFPTAPIGEADVLSITTLCYLRQRFAGNSLRAEWSLLRCHTISVVEINPAQPALPVTPVRDGVTQRK